ncbi:hypothetical protein [Nocardia wallacei]|uniref:hypothetical protein n=1 Tax=Nocardia wallacei TaxID=480035 RepID=UPI00245890BE|nr:hypothetical protein [Nocardia wallacei]
MTENQRLTKILGSKAEDGVKIRMLLGDPDSDEVVRRSVEEGIGPDTISAKIRNALAFFEPLRKQPGIEFRLHSTA